MVGALPPVLRLGLIPRGDLVASLIICETVVWICPVAPAGLVPFPAKMLLDSSVVFMVSYIEALLSRHLQFLSIRH